jgi:hypothetical protein
MNYRSLSLAFAVALIASSLLFVTAEKAYAAWGINAKPKVSSIARGQSAAFTISVTGKTTFPITLKAQFQGFTISFSNNNQPAPFTSQMTVTPAKYMGKGGYGIRVDGVPPPPNPRLSTDVRVEIK